MPRAAPCFRLLLACAPLFSACALDWSSKKAPSMDAGPDELSDGGAKGGGQRC